MSGYINAATTLPPPFGYFGPVMVPYPPVPVPFFQQNGYTATTTTQGMVPVTTSTALSSSALPQSLASSPQNSVSTTTAPYADAFTSTQTATKADVSPLNKANTATSETGAAVEKTTAKASTPEETKAQMMGRKLGEIITQLLEQNPKLTQQLDELNLDDWLANPQEQAEKFRAAYQSSRVARFAVDRLAPVVIKTLPPDVQGIALDFYLWLKGDTTTRNAFESATVH